MNSFREYCRQQAKLIEEALTVMVPDGRETMVPVLFAAMRYSLFAGGKRLRPVLLMAAADAVGGSGRRYLNLACGLEMIHTYSLIHDDLPGMDNDDYRRGKLTCHKVYGEGMAILAGDSLLTDAFTLMLSQPAVDEKVLLTVVREISRAAGSAGMAGGQALDLVSAGRQIDYPTLRAMHKAKTGALFRAAIRAGAILAGGTEPQIAGLTAYAEQFGLAFQITDDILDVAGDQKNTGKPVGSDERNNKATYVSEFSLPEARQRAANAVNEALQAIKFFGPEADVLREAVRYLISRDR